MEIRPATIDDVEQVLPMVQKLADLHEGWDRAKYPYLPGIGQMYRNWLISRAQDARSVFLVAERQGRVVGFLVGTVEREIPIYRLKEYGFIHDLWVEPDYRNEGIGRQMAMLAIERFGQVGMKQIRLDTAIANDAARGLFRSCGFRESNVEMLIEVG